MLAMPQHHRPPEMVGQPSLWHRHIWPPDRRFRAPVGIASGTDVVDASARRGITPYRIAICGGESNKTRIFQSSFECGAIRTGTVVARTNHVLVEVAENEELVFRVVSPEPHPVCGLD